MCRFAGLDTFGYRGRRTDLRVFEVDHPATQAWKRERLADAGIEVPATLTFAPVDFETDTLAAGLAAAGFDRTAPAVFVWLGVVFYLTPEAVDATLDYIATQAAPTEVIFDYLRPPDTDEDRDYARARAERLAAEGEPVLSTTTPADLAARLRTFGFTDLEDHAAPDLLAAYDTPEFRDAPPQGLRAVRIARARRSDT
ncbi:class I SAM-dependent methyltransferase [Nocardia takedensis]|uniref:class I SAM-dependent methyltransferase n=1 Tax=Nocardia takedensis TaxID=259390 RepID=UPI0002D6DDC6|nr:SAM-dependent methyltransferase [Nocardia takedensis]